MASASLPLDVRIDESTGQLLSVRDPEQDMSVLSFAPGSEFELNERPLATRCVSAEGKGGEHVTVMDAEAQPAYKAGQRFTLRRYMVMGGRGHHTGRSGSLHIRYELRRVPWGDWKQEMDQIWGGPLEAPLYVETLGAPCARTEWFGPETRMRAYALGGTGPREHVSLEDGPVQEVVPWLAASFRNAFPGQQTLSGALYYHPDDERWVWVVVRRPHVGGRIEFREDGQAFRFAYFKEMAVHDELLAPEISLFWGRGLGAAERVFAEQFDAYEEPPSWWWNTTWFWLHPMWQPDSTFEQCERAVDILADQCGVTGFGLGIHDIPWSGRDIDVRGFRACPRMGGEDGLKRLCDRIHEKGGHSYIWSTRTAMFPAGEYRDRWAVRGSDGRRITLTPQCERGVKVNIIDCMDRDFMGFYFDWMRTWIQEIGVDGIFWDSGMQPMPPDFADRPDIECPGEAMVAPLTFYEQAYRYGRSLSKDFFMWVEGISADMVSNAYSVDDAKHGAVSGHPFMHRIADLGPRRLVWRSAWPHHLGGAFPFINPVSDINLDPGPATYAPWAADPMNQWICRTVRERGVRHAVGVGDGLSVLDEFLVASPKITGRAVVPEALAKGDGLTHEITGATVQGQRTDEGVVFDLPESGAWKMG